jgi:hypothetical protein
MGVKTMMPKFTTIALVSVAFMFSRAALGAEIARPGTINYVEGAAYLDGQPVTDKSVGTAELNPGEELSTRAGKAEILLTPGVFLRLDDNSTVKMISPDLTHTQVALEQGRAGVEVDEIHSENNLDIVDIVDAGVTTQLLKNGYYEFNADQPTAAVFDGKAAVEVADGKYRVVKSHHELALVAGPNDKPLAKEKPADFNTKEAKDDLYNWNSLRSQYLAEANHQIAGEYADEAGFAPGWYWDPSMRDYTFLGPGAFYSPFGWGFYPLGWYGGGWYGGGLYGGGWYGNGWRGGNPHLRSPHGPVHPGAPFRGGPAHPSGFAGGGSHGNPGFHSMGAGGFHESGGFGGGGGGFHGGGGRR